MISLKVGKQLTTIVNIGTQGVHDQAKEQRIRMVNSLSFCLSILAASVGIFYYCIGHQLFILIPALCESILAISGLYFTYKNRYRTAALYTYFVQCAAALYFGLVLGNIIDLQAMIIFLMLITFRLFTQEEKTVRNFCLVSAITILIIIELGSQLQLIQPISLSPVHFFVFKYVAVAGVIFLVIIIGKPYVISNDELIRSNYFKRMFVAKICHELRIQLNNISLATNLLKIKIKEDSHLRKIEPVVDMLNICSDIALSIVNSVLSMSKIESGKTDPIVYESFFTVEFFKKIIAVNEIAASARQITIQLTKDKTVPTILKSDTLKLYEMVSNLIGNAIKYGKKDSTVKVHLNTRGDQFFVEVINLGEALDQDKRKAIFEPYTTSKSERSTEGTGLGLFIAQNTAHAMGGEITLEDADPGEVNFTLRLPLLEGDIREIKMEMGDIYLDYQNMRVLVVDDNPMSAVLLQQNIEPFGCIVQRASSGEEAIDRIQNQPFDVIITDLKMPGIGGIGLLTFLRNDNRFRSIPVIVLTGEADNRVLEGVSKFELTNVLQKPYNMSMLKNLLAEHQPLSDNWIGVNG